MIPVCPVNTLLVKIEKKLYDSVSFDSGVTLHIDPSWHPEEFAMLTAMVISVPRGIIRRHDYAGLTCPVKPGDEILMRYDVVFSYLNQPDRQTPVYKNLMILNNGHSLEEYWRCDIQQVFAVRENETWRMINNYVYLESLAESGPETFLVVPEYLKKRNTKSRAIVRYISETSDVKSGDVVHLNPRTAQQYRIGQKEFLITKYGYILGL